MGMLGVTGYGNKEVINVHILALGNGIYLDSPPRALYHHSHSLDPRDAIDLDPVPRSRAYQAAEARL